MILYLKKKYSYFICGEALAEAIDGILIDDGSRTSLTFFVGWAAFLSLFKQDDLKSSKLNSGKAWVDDDDNDDPSMLLNLKKKTKNV